MHIFSLLHKNDTTKRRVAHFLGSRAELEVPLNHQQNLILLCLSGDATLRCMEETEKKPIATDVIGEPPKDEQNIIPEVEGHQATKQKDPAAVALGRKGGQKGGKARAEKLTPMQRSDIARLAARARWKKTE